MISEKEFINIFKKRGTSYDSYFLSDDDLKIDHFKIDETFKKKFNSFFKENKLVILRKLVYKLAPKEVIEKYHLNDFLINVAIKMYESNRDLFIKNATAVGASESNLETFDRLAERAKRVFDVNTQEFEEMMKRYVDLANRALNKKKAKVINLKKEENEKVDIEALRADLNLNNRSEIYKASKEFSFSIDMIVSSALEENANDQNINEAFEIFVNLKYQDKNKYLIVYN